MSSINSSNKRQQSTPPSSKRQPNVNPSTPLNIPTPYSLQALNLLNMKHLSPLMLPEAAIEYATHRSNASASVNLTSLMLPDTTAPTTHHSDSSVSSDSSTELEPNELERTLLIKELHQKNLLHSRNDIVENQEIFKTLNQVHNNITKNSPPQKKLIK